MPAKTCRLRRADTCIICSAELAVGAVASWDREARTVTCVACANGGAPPGAGDQSPVLGDDDGGRPGASLARECERRRGNRERRVREAHPRIGGLLLACNDEPQHQKAFRQGEQGELDVATSLAKAVGKVEGSVLHNRRMPGALSPRRFAPSQPNRLDNPSGTSKQMSGLARLRPVDGRQA